MREGGSRSQMDFGTYFHDLLENLSRNPQYTASDIIAMTQPKVRKRCPNLPPELKQVCEVVFNRYAWYFQDCDYQYLDPEAVFKVPFKVPGYRTITLRGRFDDIIQRPDGTLWIQENKTKERINTEQLVACIPFNLQTMLYAVAAEIKYGKRVSGIVYNVIRKPTNRPSKVKMNAEELEAYKKANPKSSAKTRTETQEEFLERLDSEIAKDPGHFFMRWESPLSERHLNIWKSHTLIPILISLIQWWESIKHDPFSPWELRGQNGNVLYEPNLENLKLFKAVGKGELTEDAARELMTSPYANPHHWQRPFGVYDSLTNGVGDFYEVIALGRRNGVTTGNNPFQELVEE